MSQCLQNVADGEAFKIILRGGIFACEGVTLQSCLVYLIYLGRLPQFAGVACIFEPSMPSF